jgi:hypothetical protein
MDITNISSVGYMLNLIFMIERLVRISGEEARARKIVEPIVYPAIVSRYVRFLYDKRHFKLVFEGTFWNSQSASCWYEPRKESRPRADVGQKYVVSHIRD